MRHVAYRDDRQALELQLAELERENERLKKDLADAESRARQTRAQGRDAQKASVAMKGCPACGGSMLPAAVFTGTNDRNPIPLRFSTLRFSSPTGGFTDSAPVQAKVCASCGFIFHYIEIAGQKSDDRLVIDENLEIRAQQDAARAVEGEEEPDSD